MDFSVPEELITNKAEAITREMIQDKNRELPFYPDLLYRQPPRPPENLQPHNPESKTATRPKIDTEFEENSQYQEGMISKTYQRPDKSYFQEPRDLESLVMLYNILLLINCYTGNNTTKCHSRSMGDNRDLTGAFH